MSIVNVRVAHIRPKYQNLKEWMQDPNNVYIGRGEIVFIDNVRFPPIGSLFCNPFKIGKDGTREEVLRKYESYIINRLNNDPELCQQFLQLKGKTLGCWCHPDPCHGDVLLRLLTLF